MSRDGIEPSTHSLNGSRAGVRGAGALLAEIDAQYDVESSVPDFGQGLNIISCPSCSRVENEAFVELAEKVRDLTRYASEHDVTIAVMGCRVNGPGETDDADLGLWCGPGHVNLKRGPELVGVFTYEEILTQLRQELDTLIEQRAQTTEHSAAGSSP